jgi:hypothetical protein
MVRTLNANLLARGPLTIFTDAPMSGPHLILFDHTIRVCADCCSEGCRRTRAARTCDRHNLQSEGGLQKCSIFQVT